MFDRKRERYPSDDEMDIWPFVLQEINDDSRSGDKHKSPIPLDVKRINGDIIVAGIHIDDQVKVRKDNPLHQHPESVKQEVNEFYGIDYDKDHMDASTVFAKTYGMVFEAGPLYAKFLKSQLD